MLGLWRSNPFVYSVTTLLLLAPIFLVHDVPLYDLPAHLARQYILFGPTSPYYAPQWRFVPNLALDIWVSIFYKVFTIDTAVRLFLAVVIVQFFWGAISLHNVIFKNNHSRLILCAALFAYNGPFLFGFVNLSFGLGMALWTFAIWFRWRDKLYIQILLAVLSCLMITAHLFAFGVYAVVLISFILGDFFKGSCRLKSLLIDPIHLIVPILIYLTLMPRAEMSGVFRYNSITQKIADVYSCLGLYNPYMDMLTLFSLLIALILGWRQIKLASVMWLPLASLGIIYLLLPHNLGQGSFVDYRMPTAFFLFACASIDWCDINYKYKLRVEGTLFAICVLRMLFMIVQWHAWQADFLEFRRAFHEIPIGSKLLTLSANPNKIDFSTPPPLGHVDALAVIDRSALVPDLFAGLAHEIIIYREAYVGISTQEPSVALAPDFDFVLLLRPENIPLNLVPHYSEISRGRSFILGKLIH